MALRMGAPNPQWGCTIGSSPCGTLKNEHAKSEHKEDVFIATHFFCDECVRGERRFFVEMSSGISRPNPAHSNTVLFEKSMHWKGMLVDTAWKQKLERPGKKGARTQARVQTIGLLGGSMQI